MPASHFKTEHLMVANDDDEMELIEASRRGDEEALAMLITRYQKMVHALTFRMSGSAADAADLAQEAFIAAIRRFDSYRSEARFSSWLYRITVNTCLNWKKRVQRRDVADREWQGQLTGNRLDATFHEGGELARQVQDALMKLKPKQRAALILTTYDGLKHAEAARVLGCSETTVSWRVFAARAKLRRLLEHLSPRKGTDL